jgi:hypothetical protein
MRSEQQSTPETHFSVIEIAKLWNVSTDFARTIFSVEPGVLKFQRPSSRFKRAYTTLRVPASVLSRVQTRLGGVR